MLNQNNLGMNIGGMSNGLPNNNLANIGEDSML
jgi:hypothetical protein